LTEDIMMQLTDLMNIYGINPLRKPTGANFSNDKPIRSRLNTKRLFLLLIKSISAFLDRQRILE
jgi:hypothetical protein